MRKRLRSTIKWGGTVLTVLLLVVWVGSAWWWCVVNFVPTPSIQVTQGRAIFIWQGPVEVPELRPRPFVEANTSSKFYWWFGLMRSQDFAGGLTVAWAPIWSIALLPGAASALLWHRDRRRQPGLCSKCGYDLRGNASGVCPECGGVAPRELKVES